MKLIKEEKLLFGLPIKMKNLGTIYQPTLKDFIDNNIDIQKFMGLFSIKIDLLVDNSEGLKNFDFFLLQIAKNENSDIYIYQLIKYLKLLNNYPTYIKRNRISFENISKSISSTNSPSISKLKP